MTDIFNNILELQNTFFKQADDFKDKMFDNLFSANSRGAMIRQHGGTQAQIMQVEFNKATGKAEICN